MGEHSMAFINQTADSLRKYSVTYLVDTSFTFFLENAALKDARAALDEVLGDEIFWDDFSKN